MDHSLQMDGSADRVSGWSCLCLPEILGCISSFVRDPLTLNTSLKDSPAPHQEELLAFLHQSHMA